MRSAGLLPYRIRTGLEVLVAHPGGPFWAARDEGAWSVVKGLIEPGEEPAVAALREFTEETGWVASTEGWVDLGEVRLRSGKRVSAFAVEADFDPATLVSETFTVDLRGKARSFPEIDRVAWFDLDTARRKLNPAQSAFIDRLERHVR